MLTLKFTNVFAVICLLGSSLAHPVEEALEERNNNPGTAVVVPITGGVHTSAVVVTSVTSRPAPTGNVTVTSVTSRPAPTGNVTVTSVTSRPAPTGNVTTTSRRHTSNGACPTFTYVPGPTTTVIGYPVTVTSVTSRPAPTGNVTVSPGSSLHVTTWYTTVNGTNTPISTATVVPDDCSCVCNPTATGYPTIFFPTAVTTGGVPTVTVYPSSAVNATVTTYPVTPVVNGTVTVVGSSPAVVTITSA